MRHNLTPFGLAKALSWYFAAFAVAMTVAPLLGAVRLDPALVIGSPESVDAHIFFHQRLPRMIAGAMAGGGLALAGAVFQTVFRNPLSEPYTLGVTGGAVVGAVAAISIPGMLVGWGPFSSVQIFSLCGAGISLRFLYRLSRRPEGIAMNTLLLAGITVNILASGIVLFIRYMVSPNLLIEVDRWLMGGIDVVGYNGIASILPFLLPGVGLLLIRAVDLNAIELGDDLAMGYGVDLKNLHLQVFIGGGLMTAAVVSLAGPIGFVGLVVPHIVRRLSGHDHRIVAPASFLLGAAILVGCDTVARTIIAPTEMPVGIITAMVGAPVFIRLLFAAKR